MKIRRFGRTLRRVDATRMAVATALVLAVVSPVAGQEREYTTVSNPFQDGFSYRIGDDLAPLVEIDGIRWRLVRVATKGDREADVDKNVPITVDLEFESRRDDAVDVLVILLLEDDVGNGLERLRCEPSFKVAAGALRELRFKFKVAGEVLLGTRNLYLFCELQE